MPDYPTSTQQTRSELFRYSLLGFAVTMVTSPLSLVLTVETLRNYYGFYPHPLSEDLFVILGYPAFCTLLSALALALSRRRLSTALLIVGLPSALFTSLAIGLSTRSDSWMIASFLLLLASLPTLSEVLRSIAKSQGYVVSAKLIVIHHIIAVTSLLAIITEFSTALSTIFLFLLWFGYPLCYLALWFESGDNTALSEQSFAA